MVCIALVAACSGGSSAPSSSPGLVTAIDRMESAELVPMRAGAAEYRSDPVARRPMPALDDSLRARMFTAIRDGAAERGINVLGDERLDMVMNDLARALNANEQPHSEAVGFLLAHYGVVEPFPELRVIRVHRDAPEDVIAEQVSRGFSMPANSPLVTLGIGINRATTTMTLIVAVQAKLIDLEPVARRHGSGAEVELKGRLLGSYREPTVYVTNPGGDVDKYRLMVRDDGFYTKVACNRGDGEYQLEVFGNDAAGPKVLANFPIYCGVHAPDSLARSGGYVPEPVTTEDAESELLAMINSARKEAELPALARDGQLARVARLHSQDMLANDYFAHVSPKTGAPSDRVAAAGIEVPDRLLENLGRDSSVEEVHHGLMRSPGHRSAILDDRVTHVGIGVATSTADDGGFVLIATQLFR